MQSLKMKFGKRHGLRRELLSGAALVAICVGFAVAWGSPFTGAAAAQDQAPSQAQAPQQQPDQSTQSKSSTFTGTVMKSGDQYMLHDSSGETFKLDDADRAQAFEGKTVRVTGQLDEQAKTIHVESITSADV